MERIIVDWSLKGQSDEAIGAHLTALGYRSPQRPTVLASTVRTLRLKHGIFQVRSQSHPRRIEGYLTVPQISKALSVKCHWIYHQINIGHIQINKDAKTGLYLFPDCPETLQMLGRLKSNPSLHATDMSVKIPDSPGKEE